MINWFKNLFQPKITIAEHYRLMDMQGDANKTELEKVRHSGLTVGLKRIKTQENGERSLSD